MFDEFNEDKMGFLDDERYMDDNFMDEQAELAAMNDAVDAGIQVG